MQILLLIFIVLILGAFALRVLTGTFRFIYKVAPLIVLWTMILFLVFAYENYDLNINKMKGKNATTIGATKD